MKKKKYFNLNDCTLSDLPSTRKGLFKDYFKNSKRDLLMMGLILTLSSLLFIIFRYINLVALSSAEDKTTLTEIYLFRDLINILLYIMIGTILSGIFKIIKLASYNEGYVFKPAFISGVKENHKDFILASAIYGIFSLFMDYLAISLMYKNTIFYYIIIIVLYFMITPVYFITLFMSSIYNDGFYKKMMISFLLYFKNLGSIMMGYVTLIAPLLLLLIGNTYIQLFVPVIYTLLYLPLGLLQFSNVMNHVFDKNINLKSFPELVNKGLYSEKTAD